MLPQLPHENKRKAESSDVCRTGLSGSACVHAGSFLLQVWRSLPRTYFWQSDTYRTPRPVPVSRFDRVQLPDMEHTYLSDQEEGVGDMSNIFGEQGSGWVLMDPLGSGASGMETEATGSSAIESDLFEVNHGRLRNTKSAVGMNVLVMWRKEWRVGKVVSVSPDSGYDSCGRLLRLMYTVMLDDGSTSLMDLPRIKSTHEKFVRTPGLEALRVIIADIHAPGVPGAVQEEKDRSILFGHEGRGNLVYVRNVDPMSAISMSVVKKYEGEDRVGLCIGRNVYKGLHGGKREFLYMVIFDDNVTRLLTCDEMVEASKAFYAQDRVPIRAVL